MPLISIENNQVNFPFEPYDCQVTYMQKVLECLKGGKNGILESPTGTGKTLCLLCSSLTWLESMKAHVKSNRALTEAQYAADPQAANMIALETGKGDLARALSDAVGTTHGTAHAAPRIIYASRTHSQLTQAIQELKRTAYGHMRVCVLGSREQLCIHPTVRKEENNVTKVHLCRAKVNSRTCGYFNNVENLKGNFRGPPLDIEDLVALGEKNKCCPYYVTRELKSDADIIFLPYNYLLDPKSRRAHGIELHNNIVIFDEAHNVERICEEAVSFDWTSAEQALAIQELDDLIEKIKEQTSQDSANDVTAADLGGVGDGGGFDFDTELVLQLKANMLRLEAFISMIDIDKPEGICRPGNFIFELLKAADFTYDNKNEIIDQLDLMVQYLTSQAGSGLFSRKGTGLSKLSDVLKIVFSQEKVNEYQSLENHQRNVSKCYKVFVKEVKKDFTKQKKAGWDADPPALKGKAAARVLSYWCFSPGAAMQELKQLGARCIILTSGTLSPMSSFKKEMGIRFDVELENSHVIEKEQVWIGVVGKGPDATELCSSYANRSNVKYQQSLGNAMVNYSRIVPHGLLLFFPSYPVMDQCLQRWTSENIWSRIEQYKPIFIEPKRKQEFAAAMDGFYAHVHDPTKNGAVFAAVCRGKVSEGLDFSDNNGRAVVIMGLPFPPRMDPRVMLKMAFLDENAVVSGASAEQGLTGREWYRQQASRAVNQAIGRVIRHKQDYGAIILCDNRFQAKDAIDQLPKWVKPCLKVYPNFGSSLRDLTVFFKEAERKLPPAPKVNKQRISALTPGCVGAFFEPTLRSRQQQIDVSKLERSCDVHVHVPSLNKRRDDTASDEMSLARMKLTYGAATTSQTSSSSTASSSKGFLDALDVKSTGPISFRATSSDSAVTSRPDAAAAAQTSERRQRKKIVLKDPQKVKLESARAYIAEAKRILSAESYNYLSASLTSYKDKADYDEIATCLTDIFINKTQNHHMLRSFYRFIKLKHKQQFNALCKKLTGQGCDADPSDLQMTSAAAAAAGTKKRPLTSWQSNGGEKKVKVDKKGFSDGSKDTTKCAPVSESIGNLDATTHLNTDGLQLGKAVTSSLSSASSSASSSSDLKPSVATCSKADVTVETASVSDDASAASSSTSTSHDRQSAVSSAVGSGNMLCVKCGGVARKPLTALCNHVCCLECWKEAIASTRQCPRCGAKVKRKHFKIAYELKQ